MTVVLEVGVEESSLHAAGWHQDTDCDHDFCANPDDYTDQDDVDLLVDAIREMHTVLHPDVSDVERCLSAPCNRLPRLPAPVASRAGRTRA